MEKQFMNQQTGISYTLHGDYYIPNLIAPQKPEYPIGIWGQRRLEYLKNHRRILYVNLLTSGELYAHLHEIDIEAYELWDNLIWQMAKSQGVTEQLKAENQMLWVGRMNNIRACVEEIIKKEFIYL